MCSPLLKVKEKEKNSEKKLHMYLNNKYIWNIHSVPARTQAVHKIDKVPALVVLIFGWGDKGKKD